MGLRWLLGFLSIGECRPVAVSCANREQQQTNYLKLMEPSCCAQYTIVLFVSYTQHLYGVCMRVRLELYFTFCNYCSMSSHEMCTLVCLLWWMQLWPQSPNQSGLQQRLQWQKLLERTFIVLLFLSFLLNVEHLERIMYVSESEDLPFLTRGQHVGFNGAPLNILHVNVSMWSTNSGYENSCIMSSVALKGLSQRTLAETSLKLPQLSLLDCKLDIKTCKLGPQCLKHIDLYWKGHVKRLDKTLHGVWWCRSLTHTRD